MTKVRVVILAAGKGQRMYSAKPKVLHTIAGKTLLNHILATLDLLELTLPPIIITGYQSALIRQEFAARNVILVQQEQQLGTGHALQQALPLLASDEQVLILCGDVPLITAPTLLELITNTAATELGLITAVLPHPQGYGRIIRDRNKQIRAIVEEKDADPDVLKLEEVNAGIYCVAAQHLHNWLPNLSCNNAQEEYYLTDLVSCALRAKIPVRSFHPQDIEEIFGVNDRLQLHNLERFWQYRYAQQLMRQGVTIQDAHRLDIKGEVQIGQDVCLDINVVLSGTVRIGDGCVIGPQVLLHNTVLGNNVTIKANSVIEGAEVADGAVIGPFARIRPGTQLAAHARIGNFVEIKNSKIGMHSKINHLSYVGDSDVGCAVNIGAGTITCNYDGYNKFRTTIGDNAFIGSGTELVAPVAIGAHATIGAGSTITKDAPAHQLTVARNKQKTIATWIRPAAINFVDSGKE